MLSPTETLLIEGPVNPYIKQDLQGLLLIQQAAFVAAPGLSDKKHGIVDCYDYADISNGTKFLRYIR